MTDLDTRRPEFTTAMRGYDRMQVDDYIERLQQMIQEAEERARAAESDSDSVTLTTVGPRVTEIFELATAEAREVRGQAKSEASRLLSDARREAKEIVERAGEEAARMLNAARQDHQTMLEEYELERERMQAEVDDLDDRRAGVLGELRRLHDMLAAASGFSAAVPASEAPTAVVPTSGLQAELPQGELPELAPPPAGDRRAA